MVYKVSVFTVDVLHGNRLVISVKSCEHAHQVTHGGKCGGATENVGNLKLDWLDILWSLIVWNRCRGLF